MLRSAPCQMYCRRGPLQAISAIEPPRPTWGTRLEAVGTRVSNSRNAGEAPEASWPLRRALVNRRELVWTGTRFYGTPAARGKGMQ